MMFAFASLLPFFTAGNKYPTGLREFLSFCRTKPLLPLPSEGKTAERRHGGARARSAGEEHCGQQPGSLWCHGMQPIQLQRGRLAGLSLASSAEVCYHRLTGVGTWGLDPLLR